jgi:hypothetical protein
MEENTNLMDINLDLSGMIAPIIEAFNRLRVVTEEIKETILSGFLPMIRKINDSFIHCISSPREWHLMKYSKKQRIRKKYRDRLLRRLAFVLVDYVGQ